MSAPVLSQEEDKQVNLKWSTRFGGLEELATDKITNLFLRTIYSGNYVSYTATKLD